MRETVVDLKKIFEHQEKFTAMLLDTIYGEVLSDLSDEFKDEMTIYYAYCAIKEMTEVVDETNYKHHVFERKSVDQAKVLEELVDVFKFWLNVVLVRGFTAEEFFEEYIRKSAIVQEKFMLQVMAKAKRERKERDGLLHPGSEESDSTDV